MQLQDSFSLFILPFSFDSSTFDGLDKNTIWERSKISITDNFLFPQVRNYLGANLNERAIEMDSALIYDLKDSFAGTKVAQQADALTIINLFKKRHRITTPDDDIEFKFLVQKKKLTSVKLLLFPLTSVGMIIFGIEICSEKTSGKLMALNYQLEKYKIARKTKISIVPNSDHVEEQKQIELIYNGLNKINDPNKPTGNYWQMSQLVSLFTHDLQPYNPILTNSGRFHIFTYLQIESKEDAKESIEDFGRIVRCQNENYNPIMVDFEGNELIRQTFDNIYIGCSVEGAGIMVDTHSSKSLVLEQYKDNVLSGRYLWTYILVYHQRLALCSMIERLSALDITKKTTKDSLLELVSQFSKVMLKSRFVDISDFTQHNTYYKFCMRNLGVTAYYSDLDEKIRAIDNVIDEKNDKELVGKNKKMEKLVLLLLVPQILFAFFALNVEIFGAQATPNETLKFLYGNSIISSVILIMIILLAIPAFYLWGIVLIDFFRKDKK